jgi:hypothetical protein
MKRIKVFAIGVHDFVKDVDTAATDDGWIEQQAGQDYCWRCGAFKTEAKGRSIECRTLVTAPKARRDTRK